ncbi:MAG: SurA N-terminal domain-containing protein [Parcubacteria group bacterium]
MNRDKIIGIVLVVLVVAGVAVYGFKKGPKETAVATKTETVAKVNGIEITKATYESQLASTISTLKTQGVDTEKTENLAQIKTQVLDDLINNELVKQEIEKSGITASPEEVEKQFQAIVTQLGGADKLKTQLETAKLTEAQLRENLAKQIAVQAYLLKNIDTASVTVTDAEIKKFYDDNVKGQAKAPALKEVSDQIKQQITTNKQQVLVNALIASLKTKATIEKSAIQ